MWRRMDGSAHHSAPSAGSLEVNCRVSGGGPRALGNLRQGALETHRQRRHGWPETMTWRWRSALAVTTLSVALLIGVVTMRQPILRAAGWALVVDETIEPADVVVIGSEAGAAGVLEAVDLLRGGLATRVAVFADPPNAIDQEFLKRGVPYEDRAAAEIRQLRMFGVRNVERIPRSGAGTAAEVRVLPDWCRQHAVGSIVVVGSRDHSRRLRRQLDRAMRGQPMRVAVRAARYSNFDPDHWWHTRDGVRTELIELQKLAFDLISHPGT